MSRKPLRHVVFPGEFENVPLAREATLDQAGNHSESPRTNREIEVRDSREDLFPETLDGAPHQSNEFRTERHRSFSAAFFRRHEIAALAYRLAFGHVAYRARIHDNQFGIGFSASACMACRLEKRGNGFAVAHVHLAAVGVDMEFKRHTGTRLFPEGTGLFKKSFRLFPVGTETFERYLHGARHFPARPVLRFHPFLRREEALRALLV